MNSTKTFLAFSGLINPIYLNSVYGTPSWINETVTFIIFGIVIYFMSMSLVVITDVCLSLYTANGIVTLAWSLLLTY